ncbi:RecB family exonuclease [Elusimicrobiota bacterium]
MVRPLSYSSLSMYQECPQRYKFRYIDRIKEKPKHYFSFGQSVHTALQFLYGPQLIAPMLDEVLKHYKSNWVREGYKDSEEENKYFLQGKQMLNSFYSKHIKDWKPAFSTEQGFEITIDGAKVRGKIDRIDILPSGNLHIIDYKTGKAFEEGRALSDAQLTLYQLACEDTLGKKAEILTLYHVPSLTPSDSSRHNQDKVDALKQEFSNTRSAIENEQFNPKPVNWRCQRCDYLGICPAFSKKSAQTSQKTIKPSDVSGKLKRLDEKMDKIRTEIRELKDLIVKSKNNDNLL